MSTEFFVGWVFQSYPPVSQDRSPCTRGSTISVCSRYWRAGSQCSVLVAHLSVLETLYWRVGSQFSVLVAHLSAVCSRHWRAGSQCSVLMAHLSVLETLESRVSVQCARGSSQCAQDTGEPGSEMCFKCDHCSELHAPSHQRWEVPPQCSVLMTCTDTYDYFSRHLLMSGHEICISSSL